MISQLFRINFSCFPCGSDNKESAYNAGDPDSVPVVRKIPWRREWPLTLLFLLGEFHGQRILTGCQPWGHKELDMNERLAFSLFFQSPTHKWTLNDRISPPHFSFVGRRGEVYKEGNKKWKLPDSRRETQVFSSIPSGFVQF